MFSGLIVRAATVAGRKAGSVARLAFSLNRGVASSSNLAFFDSQIASSDRRESSESLLASLRRVEDDEEDEALSSESLTTIFESSSISIRDAFGLDSWVDVVLVDEFLSRDPLAA